VLTRSPRERSDGAKEIAWDAKSPGDWTRLINGAEVVINLTGKSVDCRYSEANRKAIIASRVDSTLVLGRAIAQCNQPPRVWLNCSSATIYKHTFETPMDEAGETGATPEAKDEFSIEVIRQWERALDETPTPRTRKVTMRITLVFGRDGGVFPCCDGSQSSGWAVKWVAVNNSFHGSMWTIFCARSSDSSPGTI
jgi:uncharacterized protein